MIYINLLPEHLRPIKRTPVPYLVSTGLFVVAVLFMGISYIGTRHQIVLQNSALESVRSDLRQLEDVINRSKSLAKRKRDFASRLMTIKEIAGDRIVWSRQLWNLSRLTLDNMWYDKIQVKQIPIMEEKTTFNPQTQKEETKNEMVMYDFLVLEGFIARGEDGNFSLGELLERMAEDEEFSALFELGFPTFSDADEAGQLVRKFTLECRIKAQGADTTNDA